jgi:hypothetical protein
MTDTSGYTLKVKYNLPKFREQCLLMPIGELIYLTDWQE